MEPFPVEVMLAPEKLRITSSLGRAGTFCRIQTKTKRSLLDFKR